MSVGYNIDSPDGHTAYLGSADSRKRGGEPMSDVIMFLQAAYYVASITWIVIRLFPKVRGMFRDKESRQSED